ncbi:hypothetical protein B0H17DRAFT_1196210 [Mycena rosella]|uniref:Uncharacterized protein n=1 Tax=Mycena rosella TaxID=1033263 RepID=A0AAD7DUZ3_MYCRO|nr:hypothetical protein B0H17DRAFT_1196210 [Mycena rosella]
MRLARFPLILSAILIGWDRGLRLAAAQTAQCAGVSSATGLSEVQNSVLFANGGAITAHSGFTLILSILTNFDANKISGQPVPTGPALAPQWYAIAHNWAKALSASLDMATWFCDEFPTDDAIPFVTNLSAPIPASFSVDAMEDAYENAGGLADDAQATAASFTAIITSVNAFIEALQSRYPNAAVLAEVASEALSTTNALTQFAADWAAVQSDSSEAAIWLHQCKDALTRSIPEIFWGLTNSVNCLFQSITVTIQDYMNGIESVVADINASFP